MPGFLVFHYKPASYFLIGFGKANGITEFLDFYGFLLNLYRSLRLLRFS